MSSIGELQTRTYENFRGVDFSGGEVNNSRSPNSKNMWKNYSNLGKCIESRPDIELLLSLANNVYGLFFYKINSIEHIIIHSGASLIDYNTEEKTTTIIKETGMKPSKSSFFVFNNILYIKDGLNYLKYDGETCSEVEGFIPTTTIKKTPLGSGESYQDVNLLTGKRKNTFCADGTSTVYQLDSEELSSSTVRVWINDVEIITGFETNTTNGQITFTTAPTAPATDGQDNVTIEFEVTVPGNRNMILKCSLLTVFDNRIFFAGNIDYPNVLWHSSLDNPEYCSTLDRYPEGIDLAPIKALVPGNEALYVIKEPSQSNTTVFYHTPTIDTDEGKCYPSSHSNITTGCVSTGINFGDDVIFFSNRGMEGITGSITSEQLLSHRSSMIDSKILKETNYKNLILEEWKGYLLAIVDNKIYLADSQNMFTNQNHYEYEWFYWEISKNIISTFVKDDVLYIGTSDGIYKLTKTDTNIEAYWCTTEDFCNYPQMRKTTNKKCCIIDLNGNIKIDVKTDNNEFETIGEFTNSKGYISPKIKKKKWKDIQLKLYSDEPFQLERITLGYYIDSYIK